MATARVPIPAKTPEAPIPVTAPQGVHEKLNKKPRKVGILIFGVVLIIGVIYAGSRRSQ